MTDISMSTSFYKWKPCPLWRVWYSYHFVWIPKYGGDIFVGEVTEYTKEVLRQILLELGCPYSYRSSARPCQRVLLMPHGYSRIRSEVL